MLVGLVGSVLPVLPGLPFVIWDFCCSNGLPSANFLLISLIAWASIIIMVVIEYLIPNGEQKIWWHLGLPERSTLWGTIVMVFVFLPPLLLDHLLVSGVGELIDEQ